MSKIIGKNSEKETVVYIISFPITEIHNGEVHVHKEKFKHETKSQLLSQIGRFISDLEAKDGEGKLMIYPLTEAKFLNVQEKIARINNSERKNYSDKNPTTNEC